MSSPETEPSPEVDFDKLENEASKVFALWELMAAGDAAVHPAAAPATGPAAPATNQTAATAAPGSPARDARDSGADETWTSAATSVDVPTMQALEPARDLPGDRTLDDIPRAAVEAALQAPQPPPPVVPEAAMPSVVIAAELATAPAAVRAIASTSASATIRTTPLNIVPFPEQGATPYALDEAPPMRSGGGPIFWLGAVAVLLALAGGGIYWLARDGSSAGSAGATTGVIASPVATPTAAPSPPPTATTATAPIVAQPVVAQPVVAQPVVAQPVVAQPVVAQPIVAQPVVAQPVVAQPAAAPVAAAEARTTEPASTETGGRRARPRDENRATTETPSTPRVRPATTIRGSGRGAGFVSDNPY